MTAQGEAPEATTERAKGGVDDGAGQLAERGAGQVSEPVADAAEGRDDSAGPGAGQGVQADVARTFGGALPLPVADGASEPGLERESEQERGCESAPEDAMPLGYGAQQAAEQVELVQSPDSTTSESDDDVVAATQQLPQFALPPMPTLPPPRPASPPPTPAAEPASVEPALVEPAPAESVPFEPTSPESVPRAFVAEEPAEAATLLLPPVPADEGTPPPQSLPGATPAAGTQLPPPSGTSAPYPPHAAYEPASNAAPAPHTAYAPPPAVPVSVPVAGPEVAEVKRRARHGDSVSRRTVQALHRLVSSTARETTIATETARAIQQPVFSGRQLAVTSIRGGAGKSTVAALLSLTYAHYRNDPTLTVEADPALGTIPGRLGASEIRWTCTDLARIVNPSMRLTDITGYLVRLPGGGWLLPASQGAVGAQLDLDTYRVVITSLGRYFGTTVVDCETLPAEVARTSLTTTQARVLVTPATVEGVAATRSVLDWMSGLHPRTLRTTVVAMAHAVPDTALDEAKASRHLAVGGATVVSIPYDRHLAAGGAIRTDLLGHHTRAAAARLAAECMTRAVAFDQP